MTELGLLDRLINFFVVNEGEFSRGGEEIVILTYINTTQIDQVSFC